MDFISFNLPILAILCALSQSVLSKDESELRAKLPIGQKAKPVVKHPHIHVGDEAYIEKRERGHKLPEPKHGTLGGKSETIKQKDKPEWLIREEEQEKAKKLVEEEIKRMESMSGAEPKQRIKISAVEEIESMVKFGEDKFTFGCNDPKSEMGDYPPRQMGVKPFKIDKHPVTNADFAKFKRAKVKYQTDAEKQDWSYVFYSHVPKYKAVRIDEHTMKSEPWWIPVKHARWNSPFGGGSRVSEMPDHPVVHVSWYDAMAFCMWAHKRLPTEFEWEYATRGQLRGKRYPWGDRFERSRFNFWQGLFPAENKISDGFDGLSPVNAYKPQNNFGMYDMVGNTWEWTSTEWFMPRRIKQGPRNITEEFLPSDPNNRTYVVKGGSFVDSRDGHFNLEARCSSRKSVRPHMSIENIGFRCAETLPILVPKLRKPEQTKISEVEKTPTEPNNVPIIPRKPRRHFLNETWEYKVKKVLEDVMAGDLESADSVLQGLKKKKHAKDEL